MCGFLPSLLNLSLLFGLPKLWEISHPPVQFSDFKLIGVGRQRESLHEEKAYIDRFHLYSHDIY